MTTANATETAAPKLFREGKQRKVRDKELFVGVWYETDDAENPTKKTAFYGKVLDEHGNVLYTSTQKCEKFDSADEDGKKLSYDNKAFKQAKKAASDFANAYGEEPSERETLVANLKKLSAELKEEFSEEKLNELHGLIEKLAA